MVESTIGLSVALAFGIAGAISLALAVGGARVEFLDHSLIPGVSRSVGRIAHLEVLGRDPVGVAGWLRVNLEHGVLFRLASVEHGHD